MKPKRSVCRRDARRTNAHRPPTPPGVKGGAPAGDAGTDNDSTTEGQSISNEGQAMMTLILDMVNL